MFCIIDTKDFLKFIYISEIISNDRMRALEIYIYMKISVISYVNFDIHELNTLAHLSLVNF